MASRLVVPLAVLALTASACSGGDKAADTTPPATPAPTTLPATAPSTTSQPTTTPPPTTTAAVVTTAPTTPPTTPPPTTPVVTASTLPLPVPDGFTLEEVQAIDRDFREGFRLYYEALADPVDEEVVQAAISYTAGAESSSLNDIIDLFVSDNRRVEQLPAPLVSFEILQGPTRLTTPEEVGLSVCHVAPFITYSTGPDGTQTILNDGVVTQQLSIDLRLDGGVWKRVGQAIDGQWEGVVRCQDMS